MDHRDGVSHRRLRNPRGSPAASVVEQPLPVADDVDADYVSGLDGDAGRVGVELAVARIGLIAGAAQDLILIAAQWPQHLEVVDALARRARARLGLEARDEAARGHGRVSLDIFGATCEADGGDRRPGLPDCRARAGQRGGGRHGREHQPRAGQRARCHRCPEYLHESCSPSQKISSAASGT